MRIFRFLTARDGLQKLVEAVPKFAEFDLALDYRGAKAVDDFAWGFAGETFVAETLLFGLDIFFEAFDFFFQARDFRGLVHRVAVRDPQIERGCRTDSAALRIQMIR